MYDGTTHQVSLVGAQGDMWWQTKIMTRVVFTKLGINFLNMSCHEILQVFMVWIKSDFMLNIFKQMRSLLKSIYNGYKLFIMNLVINFCKRKLTRMEVNCLFQIVKMWRLLQNWNHPPLKQKVWKSLHDRKMGPSWKKPSKIERHYQLQLPKKNVDPS